MELILNLLILQGLLGAFDTIYHHELTERLPSRPGARLEVSIHAVRAMLYGVVFAGIAWFEWHGVWAWAYAALILIEVVLTLWDFVVEDRTRKLPATERVLHTILAINGGAVFGMFALQLLQWNQQATALIPVQYGWQSIALGVFALGVFVSGVRDAIAAYRLKSIPDTPVRFKQAPRRVLVTGGTGFVGEPLVRALLAAGSEITLLTRDPLRAAYLYQGRVRCIRSCSELSPDTRIDAVINLAGAPVVGPRWSAKRRQTLLNSRLLITQDVVNWIRRARIRPTVLVQASAVGFYGCQPPERVLDENAPHGEEFMSELCQRWEDHAALVDDLGVRRVTLRFGLVFGASGGALPMLLLSYRFGFGALLGDGRQAMSWIHLDDVLGLIGQALNDPAYQGVYNAVAPQALTQSDFAQGVAQAVHMPRWLRIPGSVLRLLLGEMSKLFIAGQQATPRRLQEAGYRFRYPTLQSALHQILGV